MLTLNTGILDTVEDVMAQTLDEYIHNSTIAVKTLADVLGGEAVEEAKRWEQYCAEKIEMLYQRTSRLTDDQRKIVLG